MPRITAKTGEPPAAAPSVASESARQFASFPRRSSRASRADRLTPKARPLSHVELAFSTSPVAGEIVPGIPTPTVDRPTSASASATRRAIASIVPLVAATARREHEPRIGAAALEVFVDIDALKQRAERAGRQPAHPFVEVTEDDLGAFDPLVVHEPGQAGGLIAALEDGGSQMHVVDVQRVTAEIEIRTLAGARLAGPPRQIVLAVMNDWESAEDDVAEQVIAQMAHRRHDPPHADRGADFLGLAGAIRAGADHLLKRHDVGIQLADHFGDA